MPDAIRVLIADGEEISRLGVAALLAGAGDVEVVGQAADGRECLELAGRLAPDVVVLELAMPGMSGAEAIRRLVEQEPQPAVVLLTGSAVEDEILAALRAGALGYLSKRSAAGEVVQAIRRARRGQTTLPRALSRKLLEASRNPPRPGARHGLTQRELDVLRLLARGLDDPQIGESLGVSETTVRSHLYNAVDKLGLASRVQAVLHALRAGWATLEDSEAGNAQRELPGGDHRE